MGPIIIFDKSALEMLTVDEACWLDAHYLPIITPLFFVETLADLRKKVAKGRTPEHVVGKLAEKTPPNAGANVHHQTLCHGELLGYPIEMDRRPIVNGGRQVKTGDQRGVFFEEGPEMKAISRWQAGEFLEVEREAALVWRRMLSGLNFDEVYQQYRCKMVSCEAAKLEAVRLLNKDGSRYTNLKLAFENLDVPERDRKAIIARWKAAGGPHLSTFAPYTAHVLTVDLFFNVAIGADLISRERPSNKVDIAYLYYLPFCMVFASNDHLHERTARLFLRDDQVFVRGEDLKADLAKLDEYYSKLSDEVKERGVMSFASNPPHEGFLTTDLWDRFMRPDWRIKNEIPKDKVTDAKLLEHMNRLIDAAKQQRDTQAISDKDDDFMLIQKFVPVRMGKWRLIPPEAEKRK